MSTVGTFLQSMRRECGASQSDPILAMDWLNGRYAEVLERAPFQFLAKEGTITTVAAISAGTVTLTNGSTTVTETTSNANGWSSSVEGRFFRRRGDSEYYSISTFTDANPDTLTLARGYEGSTSTLETYDLWARYYSLASDVRHVVSVFTASGPVAQLTEVSQSDMDAGFPSRPSLGEPHYWSMAGRDSSNLLRVEFYPAPDTAEGVYYRYIQSTPSLADASTTILPQIPVSLLRAGWLSDYWSWRGASGDDSGVTLKLAQAQRFENEFQKRVSELIARECLALSPKRIRLQSRFTRHRFHTKFGREIGITLP